MGTIEAVKKHLPQRMRRHIERNLPFLKGQRLLLAISGGLDSMAMLHLFLEVGDSLGIKIHVAHINHNLRDNSCRDAFFVDNFCREHGIPCFFSDISRDLWERIGSNRENVARQERYRLLEKSARAHRIRFILTAHHREDNIETILMRIFDRGTGLMGLAGIPEVDVRGTLTYVRPLLTFSRRDISSFMEGRPYVEDETNANLSFRRNLIRHKIVPFLEEHLSPQMGEHLLVLADQARSYREIMEVALDYFCDAHRSAPQSRKYLFLPEEVPRYPESFWRSVLAHLTRRHSGYSYGARTLRDAVRFFCKGDKNSCACGPLLLSVSVKGKVREIRVVKP